ncbi:hypothetical protein NDU88_007396 [Pleurodeles waltl]|uniref:Uncharacterized protein n=1 Tax=Pleurodeles waltl TaxID=8319 RepID=A0AAV7P219_PLEWA|nr:hypothetical protein NDU88_007396 [Pleurodeles waltl]
MRCELRKTLEAAANLRRVERRLYQMKILDEIEKVRLELLSIVTQEVFDELMKNLEKKLLKLEEKITSKKQRKFIRDFKDCQAGHIMTFQLKYDHMYSEETTESNVRDCELVNKPVEEQEESDISDGNLSDVPDTVLSRVSISDKEMDEFV